WTISTTDNADSSGSDLRHSGAARLPYLGRLVDTEETAQTQKQDAECPSISGDICEDLRPISPNLAATRREVSILFLDCVHTRAMTWHDLVEARRTLRPKYVIIDDYGKFQAVQHAVDAFVLAGFARFERHIGEAVASKAWRPDDAVDSEKNRDKHAEKKIESTSTGVESASTTAAAAAPFHIEGK
ncbi:unnamed protein product, partial [Amoebophrya sp. A25]